jgi:hypothetical protein
MLNKIFIKVKVEKPKEENSIISTKKENVATTIEDTEYEIVEKEILPEKMICPDCGGITLVGLDFCDKCGGELINQDN